MKKNYAIIEIGSNNTKTHVYYEEKIIYENVITIELKKHYQKGSPINTLDKELLFGVIKETLNYTNDIHIYGCSIFRKMTNEELKTINKELSNNFGLKVEVVSQDEEANYTAAGCYKNIEYNGNMCVFIGGGGSIELIFIQNKEIIGKKYFPFGVVDITNNFPSLKDNIPTCTFKEVYDYAEKLVGEIDLESDILVLAGGDHLYWYNSANYALNENNLYKNNNQKYLLTTKMSDEYDLDAFTTSLDKIRKNSDNPKWFDGSRAMKVITNLISHKIKAKYIIPTKINMEDGIKEFLNK